MERINYIMTNKVFLIYAKQISIDDKEYKVRFHCNYTRKYRGTPHKICKNTPK